MINQVYIASNDTSARRVISPFVKNRGFQVEFFESGELLYEACKSKKSSLIIIDMVMSDAISCGFETCIKIRQISNAPIILLTEQKLEQYYIRGLTIGIDALLAKPFSPEKFIAYVRALLLRDNSGSVTGDNIEENLLKFLWQTNISYDGRDIEPSVNDLRHTLTKNTRKWVPKDKDYRASKVGGTSEAN